MCLKIKFINKDSEFRVFGEGYLEKRTFHRWTNAPKCESFGSQISAAERLHIF